ncbi:hypothetical protein CRUP_029854, partial [Coryphaenoides rupestris]
AKLRLEMEMERLRQTNSKDIDSKDEEVEEIRQSFSKKLRQMEVQLEEEYDDKQKVLKERRELETKLCSAKEEVSHVDVETEKRLRKDLKRTKALLADAQIMLDHMKNNAPVRGRYAQLKNQLEESEFTCAAAVKARKSMEVEMEDLHVQMEDISKAKQALEEQFSRLQREKNDLQSRIEEDQEDMNELVKKHKSAVSQVSFIAAPTSPTAFTTTGCSEPGARSSDLQAQLEDALKGEAGGPGEEPSLAGAHIHGSYTEMKRSHQGRIRPMQALQSQLDFKEQSTVDKSQVGRQEAKVRELETKLEFEKTQVKRLET